MPKAATPVITDCVWAVNFLCVTAVKVNSWIIFLQI